MRKPVLGGPGPTRGTRSDTNRAVQPQKMARELKFQIKIEEGSHYPCSENKGADQLRSYCAADLHLCFCIAKSRFSHDEAHIYLISTHLQRKHMN